MGISTDIRKKNVITDIYFKKCTLQIINCTVCSRAYKRAQDLKAHKTREKHHEQKNEIKTKTAVTDAILAKRTKMQQKLPKVKWVNQEIENSWRLLQILRVDF